MKAAEELHSRFTGLVSTLSFKPLFLQGCGFASHHAEEIMVLSQKSEIAISTIYTLT